MSEKSKTNKKWTSTESYRDNYDRIFKNSGHTFKRYHAKPVHTEGNTYLFKKLEHVREWFESMDNLTITTLDNNLIKVEVSFNK